jgi:lysyl-tRNA synthetase class 2
MHPMSVPFLEENDQTRARQEHLQALRQLVGNAYPNKFERSQVVDAQREDTISSVVEKYRSFQPEVADGERPAPEPIELANQQLNSVTVRLAGRIASPPRVMGKAAFVHLSDGITRLQIYVKRADVKGVSNDAAQGEVDGWELFNLLDHGDFIGVEGYLFITKTGELSIHVQQLQFLAKALLPLPDKMHGINDPEIRQRQRYADLIAGSLQLERDENDLTPRETFERRSRIISELRRILEDHGYVEVETPMLTSKATGAAARPFKTHHNALDIDLYARIAPELYLKRLLVGGFEKVYELNRNFRNEGIDRTHNPEFTMLEFYWAYADVNQMMDFCEEMLRATVFSALGHTHVKYRGQDIDFSQPFERLTMREAIARYWPEGIRHFDSREITASFFDDSLQVVTAYWFLETLDRQVGEVLESHRRSALETYRQDKYTAGLHVLYKTEEEYTANYPYESVRTQFISHNKDELWNKSRMRAESLFNKGEIPSQEESAHQIQEMFEKLAETCLIQPTFITDFPKPISPLSKASPADPSIAERFELFIDAMECANGFSELNDPLEQYQRFLDQMSQRERGDEEAMVMDEDYIRALSYGMPPAAGIGIGIDRFVMLLTNKQTIRDVILFPHMRPERNAGEGEPSEELDA